MEYFDVVNENDEVIDRQTRGYVHKNRLLHRAIHVLVHNDKGEYFIQKRSMTKDLCPGMWGTSCAGHVDSGEDYDSAAYREFKEELGVDSGPLEKLFKLDACRESGREFVWIYRCKHNGPFDLCEEEVETGEWVKPDELSELIKDKSLYTPALRYVWNCYVDRGYLK